MNLVNRNPSNVTSDLLSKALDRINNTDIALIPNAVPDNNSFYGKSSLTADLQYIGYDFVRTIWSNDTTEDASYLVIRPSGFRQEAFLEDIAKLCLKYNVDSFVIWDHDTMSSEIYDLNEVDKIFHRTNQIGLIDSDGVYNLMNKTENKLLVRSDFIKSPWGPHTKIYRINHSRDIVFGKFPNEGKYPALGDWEPAPWES